MEEEESHLMQLPMVRWLSGGEKMAESQRGGRWHRRRGQRAAGHQREAVGGGILAGQRPEQSTIVKVLNGAGDWEWSGAGFRVT
jgi:hypothetical protein